MLCAGSVLEMCLSMDNALAVAFFLEIENQGRNLEFPLSCTVKNTF